MRTYEYFSLFGVPSASNGHVWRGGNPKRQGAEGRGLDTACRGYCRMRASGDPWIPLALAGLLVLARDYAWARSALRATKRWLVRMRRRARAKRAQQVAASRIRTAADENAEEA